jgi:release factor glutamine methyltransferase
VTPGDTGAPAGPSLAAGASISASVDGVAARLRAAGCVFAEDEARILLDSARDPAELAAMVAARAGGDPLEHVVGWAEFCGLRIAVDRGVFVPRRRTELLVREAAALGRALAAAGEPVVVVDLCCGSGAVGAALAAALGRTVLHAADVDPAAVACAARNLGPAGGQVHQGDLFDALPARLRGTVGLLAANVPYVPTAAVGLLPSEARDHEAPVALDGGPDGLDVMRRVAARAARWLAPGGSLLVEAGERQARTAAGVLAAGGLATRTATDDDLGATVLIGTRPRG